MNKFLIRCLTIFGFVMSLSFCHYAEGQNLEVNARLHYINIYGKRFGNHPDWLHVKEVLQGCSDSIRFLFVIDSSMTHGPNMLFCVGNKFTGSIFNIYNPEDFNSVISKIGSAKFNNIEKGVLYLYLSNNEQPIFTNWDSSSFTKVFSKDLNLYFANETKCLKHKVQKESRLQRIYISEAHHLYRKTFYFNRFGKLLKIKKGPVECDDIWPLYIW